MKKILGLDLGSNSIGWAIILFSEKEGVKILDLGSRIIPVDGQTLSRFGAGQSVTLNSDRTQKRTARKTFDRYQLRRDSLMSIFKHIGIEIPQDLIKLDKISLWELRAKATTEKLSLEEIARVLLLLVQKRGYRAVSSDLTNKQQSEYLTSVQENYKLIKDANCTIGQYYYQELKKNPDFRIKERVLPRQAYMEEYDAIMHCQGQFYPDIFTNYVINYIKNHIIFYQRPLKSCKHLINQCTLEGKEIKVGDQTSIVGPKVANKSNPIFETFRIWNTINNLVFTSKINPNEKVEIDLDRKELLANLLQTEEKLTATKLFKVAGLSNKLYHTPDNIGKGIPGNRTYRLISKALNNKYPLLLRLQLFAETVDQSTGEIKKTGLTDITEEPLYQLWHILFSIKDQEERVNRLSNGITVPIRDLEGNIIKSEKISLDNETISNLIKIDFSTIDYGNLSVKAIKKLLPFMIKGEKYPVACENVGYRHSNWSTKEEIENNSLDKRLDYLKKGELHQPVVEKIINQLVTIMNALLKEHGEFDEIHVELARELKQSKQEREKTYKNINKNEKRNKEIFDRFEQDYGQRLTRSRIKKYKLLEETDLKCIYCGKQLNANSFLNNEEMETEHIIPKSLLFNDSFNNQVCSCRMCNKEKGNQTAYDYMKSKGEDAFNGYVERIGKLVECGKMSKQKQKHLLTPKNEIPTDFIERQLRETQYISKYALNLLRRVCKDVFATSGSITDYVKHIWGWDQVLHDVNLPIYSRNENLIEECNDKSDTQHGLRIKNWAKRVDHRHHAVDALAIACTNRALIQRLNNLNASQDNTPDSTDQQGNQNKTRHIGLDKFILSLPHPTYQEAFDAVNGIVVSCKEKKSVATTGNRHIRIKGKKKVVQSGIIVPRGALHEETIYGSIKQYDKSGKLHERYVIKRKLEDIKTVKDASLIVDTHIRNIVLDRIKSSKEEKSLYVEPLYSDKDGKKQIRTVRCFSNSTSLIPIRKNENGEWISFAAPGGNDHLALYADEEGKPQEHIPTFKHCVDRYRYGISTIIEDPKAIWDKILNEEKEYPEEFLSYLPKDNWAFMFSLRINDLVIFNMTRNEIEDALKQKEENRINNNLYRITSLSKGDYKFILNSQTQMDNNELNKPDKRFLRIRTITNLLALNPIFVKIDPLGEITLR